MGEGGGRSGGLKKAKAKPEKKGDRQKLDF